MITFFRLRIRVKYKKEVTKTEEVPIIWEINIPTPRKTHN